MQLADTHCHLFKEPLTWDLEGVLTRAREANVHDVVVPAYNLASWGAVRELGSLDGVHPALGLHPWVANHLLSEDEAKASRTAGALPGIWDVRTRGEAPVEVLEPMSLSEFRERLATELVESKAVAIGEIGLDFMIERPTPRGQFPILTTQLELAEELDLPVLVHCRNGWELLVSALQPFAGRIRGVLHGYTRPPELAAPFLRIGFYVGIGGALTRETAVRTRRSAKELPLDRIVLETDSPSVGLDGVDPGRTEPCHIRNVAETMAALRGMAVEEVASATSNNFHELFRI